MEKYHNLFSFYLCFEGEGDTGETGDTGDIGDTGDTGDTGQGQGGDASGGQTFSQDDVNRFLADDRRKHEARYKKLEQTMQSQLKNAQLNAGERQKLQQELDDLQASFRTREQQAEYERKQAEQQYQRDLKETQERAQRWESLFRSEKIDRSLLDAAGSDAFNPTLIVDLLRPVTDLKEETNEDGEPSGKLVPMVNFNDVDEKTGEPIKTLRTPAEAVKRMKELPELYGGLFKSNVVSGVGAGAAEGSVGKTGKVDVTKLSPEQYRKLREENPQALGLSPRRNRY